MTAPIPLPPPDPDETYWDERVAQLRRGQLAGVRAAAEKWRTATIALVGLVSSALIVSKPDLSALGSCERHLVQILGMVGLVLLVASSAAAMRASYGIPGKRILLMREHVRSWEHAETRRCVNFLRFSLASSAFGLLALVASIVLAIGAL